MVYCRLQFKLKDLKFHFVTYCFGTLLTLHYTLDNYHWLTNFIETL